MLIRPTDNLDDSIYWYWFAQLTHWLCLENIVVYLYWKGWTCRRLSVADISEIVLSRIRLLHYVRRTVLILCGKITTRGKSSNGNVLKRICRYICIPSNVKLLFTGKEWKKIRNIRLSEKFLSFHEEIIDNRFILFCRIMYDTFCYVKINTVTFHRFGFAFVCCKKHICERKTFFGQPNTWQA